jgi:hypothetical protein
MNKNIKYKDCNVTLHNVFLHIQFRDRFSSKEIDQDRTVQNAIVVPCTKSHSIVATKV